MTYQTSKSSNYNGQTDDKLNDYLISVDRDLSNLFRMAAPFYQFGSGTSYSVLTYTSTSYEWFSTIGGWSTTNTLLYAGTGSTYMGLQPGVGIWMGSSAFATAVFSVDPTGQMKAHAGEIGGWYIGTTTLSSTNLVFDSGNELIKTQDYVSGALGHGWQIDKNVAEFQNIRARGKITTSVFEKESISSIGGNFLVSDSDLLDADMTAADTSTMTVLGLTKFAINDIVRIKDGTSDEWFTITGSTSALGYTVTRDQGTDYSANANPVWTKGTAVVNFGVSGEGLIFMTASETNNPYIDVVTHAGSPWSALTTRVRLGNLNGFLGYASDLYGIAIGETDKYLKYDPTNGLQIKGIITATSGSDIGSSAQLLQNGNFEIWTAGVSSAPDGWTLGGAGASVAREASIIKLGTYSAKFTRAGANCTLLQNFYIDKGIDYLIGRTLTFGCWVYATEANRVKLYVLDDTVDSYSSYHTGDSTWQWLTATHTVTAASTFVRCGGNIVTGDTSAYFDGAMCVEGSIAMPFAERNFSEQWIHPSDTTTIDGGKIYTSSILADSISATAITTVKIAANAITTDKIAANAITSALVSATAITADKLSVSQLDSITVNTGSLTVDEYIQSTNYVAGTTGFKLHSSTGLEVNTGTIKGTLIDTSGSLIRSQEYTSGNNTWTCPTGVTQVYVTLVGGGGGGGGRDNSSGINGGGGGAGGLVINYPLTVTPSTGYTANVGAGGTGGTTGGGGADTAGGTGGSTVFSTLTINGGAGGQKGSSGGGGGSAANPDDGGPVTIKQGNGGNFDSENGGRGGSSVFGLGGTSGGGAGSGYGAGGGGGTGGNGGAGSGGYILITW